MGIMSLHGGSWLVMVGSDSVAIVVDRRLSNQLQLVSENFDRAFQLTDKCFFAACGFASDIQTAYRTLRFHKNLFKLREDRDMPVQALGTFVGNMLYQRRFSPWFITPLVAGINAEGKPQVFTYDFIGTPSETVDFNVAGTGWEVLYGIAEKKWTPGLDSETLRQVAVDCFVAGLGRDCLSGNGAVCHLITPQGNQRYEIETRVD